MTITTTNALAVSAGIGVATALGWVALKHCGRGLPENRSVTSILGGGAKAYETRKAVDEYLQFHFGDPSVVVPYPFIPEGALQFTEKCADLCEKYSLALQDFTGEDGEATALDVGCAVGGATFALSKVFPHVMGIDFSQSFIDAANQIKEDHSMTYTSQVEGSIEEEYTARIPDGIDCEGVVFRQGDACNLPENLAPADAILAANLLCRLPDPMKFLNRLPSLLKPQGTVVLVSPYSWLSAWTPKSAWIGGYSDSSKNLVRTAGRLQKEMERLGFELVHSENLPFIIREHVRKFQLGVSHATVWRKNS